MKALILSDNVHERWTKTFKRSPRGKSARVQQFTITPYRKLHSCTGELAATSVARVRPSLRFGFDAVGTVAW